MAAKKGNGHDPSTDRIVEVLERIDKRLQNVEGEARQTREELHAFRAETREELSAMGADVSSLRTEVASLRAETRTELGLLREEVHELRAEMKGSLEARIAKLEAAEPRIAKLEAAVFRPTGS
jgi:chromosome segregation ATPase